LETTPPRRASAWRYRARSIPARSGATGSSAYWVKPSATAAPAWRRATRCWWPAPLPAALPTPTSPPLSSSCCTRPARCPPPAPPAQCRRHAAPSLPLPPLPSRHPTPAEPVRLPAHEPDPCIPDHRLADGGDL